MKDKIKVEEMYERSGAEEYDFPKYTTQLLNLANQNAQGTRPKVVGQMSELIKEADPDSFKEWKAWYVERHPEAIEQARAKVKDHIEKLREAIAKIDDEMIEAWVRDLVLVKTAEGLLIEQAIFDYLSDKFGLPHRQSTVAEESKGIDGHLGGVAVSVKPRSYEAKTSTKYEQFGATLVKYRKTSKYLTIYYDEDDFQSGQENLFG
jgi:hypothetical protein